MKSFQQQSTPNKQNNSEQWFNPKQKKKKKYIYIYIWNNAVTTS